MRLGFAAALAALLTAGPAMALDGGRYGDVRVSVPNGDIRGYVVFFSDRGGWTEADQKALAALADEGALAVGVDTDAYLAKIKPGGDKCDQLVGDAEMLSRQLQKEHAGAEYSFPILVGIGQGGTLAGATLAEAPVNTLTGAVSIDPTASLPGIRPLCPGAPATPDGHGGFSYGPIARLSGFWTVSFPSASPAQGHFEALKQAGTPLTVEPSGTDIPQAAATLVAPHLAAPSSGGVADLPLVELPADHPTRLLAVVLSGDGGWRDLDKTIAEDLQHDGVSVVGWDSLRYFWNRKTPEQTAGDLAAVLNFYGAKWHADRIALVGYSFGANVLPFAYDLLPEALQHRVVLMSLLAFAPKTDWEITVAGWLGAPASDDAVPVAPAVASIPGSLMQCFYGQEEDDTACPGLAAQGAEVVKTAGGHHFDKDYALLARRILDEFRRRTTS